MGGGSFPPSTPPTGPSHTAIPYHPELPQALCSLRGLRIPQARAPSSPGNLQGVPADSASPLAGAVPCTRTPRCSPAGVTLPGLATPACPPLPWIRSRPLPPHWGSLPAPRGPLLRLRPRCPSSPAGCRRAPRRAPPAGPVGVLGFMAHPSACPVRWRLRWTCFGSIFSVRSNPLAVAICPPPCVGVRWGHRLPLPALALGQNCLPRGLV